MTERKSNPSKAARNSDAVSGKGDLCLPKPKLKHAANRARKMLSPTSLAAQEKAFGTNKRLTPTDQRFPENSTGATLSP
jgi:hypothetical protein